MSRDVEGMIVVRDGEAGTVEVMACYRHGRDSVLDLVGEDCGMRSKEVALMGLPVAGPCVMLSASTIALMSDPNQVAALGQWLIKAASALEEELDALDEEWGDE